MGCPPAPVYKGARGRRCGQARGAPGGVLLLPGVGLPPFPCWTRSGRREEVEGRKEGGRRAPSPCPIRTGREGGRGPALASSPLFHLGPYTSRGVPVTSRYSGKILISPGTLSISKQGFQYINLYVSTISRLLVMSVITSWTPNNLRYIKTYKLIIKLLS